MEFLCSRASAGCGPGQFAADQRGAVLQRSEAAGIQPAGQLMDGPDAGQDFHGGLHGTAGDGEDFRILVGCPELNRLSGTRGLPALAEGPQLALSQLVWRSGSWLAAPG